MGYTAGSPDDCAYRTCGQPPTTLFFAGCSPEHIGRVHLCAGHSGVSMRLLSTGVDPWGRMVRCTPPGVSDYGRCDAQAELYQAIAL